MLISSNTKNYEKPITGVYDAVFADYVDLGLLPSTYKGTTTMKHKLRLVWVLSAKDKEGNNFRVFQKVTKTIGKKSVLFAVVKDVFGKVPEGPDFEIETMIGKNVQLVVSLDTVENGDQFANIKAILPAKVSFVVPAGFVRDKDRTDRQPVSASTSGATACKPATASSASAAAPAAYAVVVQDEDIPF